MKKQSILILSMSLAGLLLAGCATSGDPVLAPPPPGLVHDQSRGVHPAHSPLFKNQLKNPPPYLKKEDLHH